MERIDQTMTLARPGERESGALLLRPSRKSLARPLSLGNFLTELRRRNVYRAALAYCVVSWLLIQIATQVFPFFEIPNATVRLVVIVCIAGFPIAMLLAWLYDLTPEGFVRVGELDLATRKERGRMIDFTIIGILTVAVSLLLFDRFQPQSIDKSIAVLPFENMTADEGNAFFADGIQDDILTSLSKIGDLRVISRLSTLPYRGEGKKNLREIGAALDVANILEGSVRRAGDRVAITVQLIDARTDRQIWAKRYDRTMSDALTLQGELAQEIAAALHARLSPEEKARIETKPTDNADAYVLYLRGRQFESRPDKLLQDLRMAERIFGEAVELDPKFALAHAMLAMTRAEIYHFYEPLESWKEKARSAAERALQLRPDLSEAHQARGLCYYWMEKDYAAALRELAVAERFAPNDVAVGFIVAAIHRRQGHWEEALAGFERMQKLAPQDLNIVRNILITNTAMRRWPAAAKAAARWRSLAPDSITARIQSAYIQFWWKGDTHAWRAQLADIPVGIDPDGVVVSGRWEGAMLERNFAEAARILEESPRERIDYMNGGTTPKSFLLGLTALARGDRAKAQEELANAAATFEKQVRASPEVAVRHANLGLCYSFMGRREEAVQEGRRAVELKPEAIDAFDGVLMQCYLALIYARVGENFLAFSLLERLAVTPGAVDSVNHSVTANDLKLRWEWDVIRNDPRFAPLVSEME